TLVSAISSSSTGPLPTHSPSRCARTRSLSAKRSTYSKSGGASVIFTGASLLPASGKRSDADRSCRSRGRTAVRARSAPRREHRFGHGDAEKIRLRNSLIDKTLPQLVVRQQLDFPPCRLRAMDALRIGRTEHHQRRPPPSIQRVLCHRFLGGRAATQCQHEVV